MFGGRIELAWRPAWPWLFLGAVAGLAAWHVLDFGGAVDPEFPRVVRPFFNRYPPAAYRLAEPGDTLDRIGLYASAAVAAMAASAILARHRAGVELAGWPSALAVGMASAWHACTPGPSFDGWHGLGWRVIGNPTAPVGLRITLGLAAVGLGGAIAADLLRARRRGVSLRPSALLAASMVLIGLRQVEIPGVEPAGYWPRVAFDLGILALGLVLIRARPLWGASRRVRPRLGLTASWAVLVAVGIGVATYHRPLARLRAVVPGRIYISAMPTYRGLAIERGRIGFRTIINLFDESSDQASPGHAEEIRFVREHGLRYLGSPDDGMESDRFLDETLALAEDPDAWPILVHCHGCMDRSPAWMGLYRFLIEGVPLNAVFGEIERHRGSRPKAVVSLQYNRKLPPRAPARFAADPTAQRLRRCIAGTVDPFHRPGASPPPSGRRVVTRVDPEPATRRR
jgi:protein tyrosine phosphatase (PTP) superfamily phosphohydrolase (DUF442 family)